MSDYKLLIDGKLVSGAMALNVVNPATEEVVAVAPRADRAQLEIDWHFGQSLAIQTG